MSNFWQGVLPAITTPFLDNGEVDHGFLAHHVNLMMEAGCTGIGEGHCDAEGRVWLYEAGDLWPSCPILFREHPSSTASTADPDRDGRERT